MTSTKVFLIVLLTGFISCKSKTTASQLNPKAVELNDNAMELVRFIDNNDSSKKAILLLDEATNLDSNYFLGHYNKLMFYNQLKEYDKAMATINKLIRLKPNAHDLYLTGGLLSEKTGDTLTSKIYFNKSLIICSSVLDTISGNNRDYEMLVTNKAINLIMLGEPEKAKPLLQELYKRETDEALRKGILLLMNKNKSELVQQYIH